MANKQRKEETQRRKGDWHERESLSVTIRYGQSYIQWLAK